MKGKDLGSRNKGSIPGRGKLGRETPKMTWKRHFQDDDYLVHLRNSKFRLEQGRTAREGRSLGGREGGEESRK